MASDVIRQTAMLTCNHTVGIYDIIFILDASFDDSLPTLRDILISPTCLGSSMLRARVLVQPTAVFETSADNLGLTLADPSHFYIELQADMVLDETGWNRDLVRPMLEYNDVFSVGGRCGHGLSNEQPYFIGRCNETVGQTDAGLKKATENSFYITETNTRGPLAWRADVLRDLGFLDEVSFFLGTDDHDLNRRALMKGWYAAYKYVPFYAPMELGATRSEGLKHQMPDDAKEKETKYMNFREARRCPNSPQGYSRHAAGLPAKRSLKPWTQDFGESLPPLPR